MTQRTFDCSVEQRTAKRLDEYYTRCGIKFERVLDKARQYKGIDLILFGKKGTIKVDEKAKYRGLQDDNAKLNTYSFELSRLCKDGKYHEGWFIDSKIETDFYCYAFPKFEDPEDMASSIKPNMQVELFKKKDIIKIVEQETTLDYIEQLAHVMSVKDTRIQKFNNFAVYKTPSYKLPESPINLLISRELVESTPNFRRFHV